MSFWRCESQTTELFSNDERIKARYAVFLQLSVQCFKFLRRKPRVELAFREILLIWEVHLRSSEIVMPKYGFSGTCCNMCLSSS